MSIKEARKLLGKKYDSLPDDEVEKLINDLSFLARGALDMAKKKIEQEKVDERHLRELASFLYTRYMFHKAKEINDGQQSSGTDRNTSAN